MGFVPGIREVGRHGDAVGHRRGPQVQQSGLTTFVAKEALACGHWPKAVTRSAVLSQISASIEQSPFSLMSYTQAVSSHWLLPLTALAGDVPCQVRDSMSGKTVIGLAYPLRRGT